MRCARTSVSVFVGWGLERTKEVPGFEDDAPAEEWDEDSCAICADTDSALSREIPMVISPCIWGVEDSASMSISGALLGA